MIGSRDSFESYDIVSRSPYSSVLHERRQYQVVLPSHFWRSMIGFKILNLMRTRAGLSTNASIRVCALKMLPRIRLQLARICILIRSEMIYFQFYLIMNKSRYKSNCDLQYRILYHTIANTANHIAGKPLYIRRYTTEPSQRAYLALIMLALLATVLSIAWYKIVMQR